MKFISLTIAAILSLFCHIAFALTPEGIVYESEAISTPASAWQENHHDSNHWMLWTNEQDIAKKRSGGAVLVSPTITSDRNATASNLPPLHSVVKDLKPGYYRVFISPPNRPLGYSLDGQHWFRHAGGELALGTRKIDKPFELWVDARYACDPAAPGGAYYDYIRFVPVTDVVGEDEAATPSIQFVETWSPEPGSADICWITSRATKTASVEYSEGAQRQRTAVGEALARNHRVRLTGLGAAKEYQGRIIPEEFAQELAPVQFTFRAAPPTPHATTAQTIDLTVPEPTAAARHAWPATVGLPFGRGLLADVRDLNLTDSFGHTIPLQADPLSRWPDGSVQWCVLSFLADTPGADQSSHYQLHAQPQTAQAVQSPVEKLLQVESTPQRWSLKSDRLSVNISRQTGGLFDCGSAGPTQLRLVRDDGQLLTAGAPDGDGVIVESNGPVRAVVKWAGPLRDSAGKESWRYLVRLTISKGLPILGVDLSVLDDQSQPLFSAVRSVELQVPFGGEQLQGAIDGASLQSVSQGSAIELLQDKVDHFRLTAANKNIEGEKSRGLAQAASDRWRLSVFLPEFWQTYPKGFAIAADGIHAQLLPQLPADAYSDPASIKAFHRLYAWFDKGSYLLRAGQLTRNQIFLRYDAAAEQTDASQWSAWLSRPLLPQASPQYLCGTAVLGRAIFPAKAGAWDDYETFFAALFKNNQQRREIDGTYGWMNYGDWFGERVLNYGNNEYDMAWTLAVQWMRTGRRDYFDRGQQMARHYSSVDTVHGKIADPMNGIVYQHSFNHVGSHRPPKEVHMEVLSTKGETYMGLYGKSMMRGAIDRQGHVFQEGNWIYAALTGDRFLWDVACRVSDNQAEKLTPHFDFGIERAGGWPLINAVAAYRHTANPYYLNAARLMIQRCLERQDPVTGGWIHQPPLSETGGVPCIGGKAFAVGILGNGILRYLEQEPQTRPEVRHMVVRGVDWLMNESWLPGHGFRYISNCPTYQNIGSRGATSLLLCEFVAFAYDQTHEVKYRDFWKEMMGDELHKTNGGALGKDFTQSLRQTIFGLDRTLKWSDGK